MLQLAPCLTRQPDCYRSSAGAEQQTQLTQARDARLCGHGKELQACARHCLSCPNFHLMADGFRRIPAGQSNDLRTDVGCAEVPSALVWGPMATYAIGDIQGCYTSLQRLTQVVRFNPQRDRLWFTGDLVNRGPDSLHVLDTYKDLGPAATTVLGNHDLFLISVAAQECPRFDEAIRLRKSWKARIAMNSSPGSDGSRCSIAKVSGCWSMPGSCRNGPLRMLNNWRRKRRPRFAESST